MGQNKTKATEKSVSSFVDAVENEQKRADSYTLIALLEKITGENAKLWGPSIIGFGQYHYKYESGREGDFMLIGFSPRKNALTLYSMEGLTKYGEYIEKFVKIKTGKSRLNINPLDDKDMQV
jgi:hypothetical protein